MPRVTHLAVLSQMLARDRGVNGLKTRHLIMLGLIVDGDGKTTLADIAASMKISTSRVRLMARVLEDGQYMQRRINADDARRHEVVATPKGRKLNQRVRGYVEQATT